MTLKTAVGLLLGSLLLGAAAWLNDYGEHFYGRSRSQSLRNTSTDFVGLVQPWWADPAAVATAVLGGTLGSR